MSASFLHIPCTRPQQRCPQLSCRADQASGASGKQQQHSSTRRRALGAALLLPAAAVVAGPRRAAAEELAAAAAAPPPTEAVASPPALDVVSWPQWVDRNFSFSYPPGFKEVADLSYAMPPKPTSGSPTGKQAIGQWRCWWAALVQEARRRNDWRDAAAVPAAPAA